MNVASSRDVTILADLVDPTNDSILTTLANYTISGLMVMVVITGAWHAFKSWNGASGHSAELMKILRGHAVGILAIEAFLGSILLIANEGLHIIPGL